MRGCGTLQKICIIINIYIHVLCNMTASNFHLLNLAWLCKLLLVMECDRSDRELVLSLDLMRLCTMLLVLLGSLSVI